MINSPGIYLIINLVNGKIYVGQTKNIKSRVMSHISQLLRGAHPNQHLQGAFNKYGVDNFYPYVAEYCSLELLTEREQYWIDYFDKQKIYNIAPVAGTCRGIKRTIEFCENLSRTRRGIKKPEHVKKAVSIANRKRVISDETRKKLSLSLSKRIIKEETRLKLSLANKGKKMAESQKALLSELKSKKIEFMGETKTIKEWSLFTGIPQTTISKRLQYGWSVDKALSFKKYETRGGLYVVLGVEYKSALEASIKYGVTERTISVWCLGRKVGDKFYPPKLNCFYKENLKEAA